MRNLSYQIIFFLFAVSIFAQSPHGDKLNIDCSVCHNADSWKIDPTKLAFDHSKTNFALIGQHITVDCKSCHQSLIFSKMGQDCISCHKDIHQATVGVDCANCHTPATWIVKDIVGLHQKGRFPLLGAHQTADCAQCHSGYTQLNFEPLNIDCYACHKQNYESTQNPNHVTANFSKECQDCHNISALSWNATNIDHSFFPLAGGHALPSCFSCHQQGGNFSGLSPDCYSCHQQNYQNTTNPNHISAGFPITCNVCHNIQAWKPASFNHNITLFPLTGRHITVDCTSCHATGYTGTPTDCYSCHQQDYQSTTDPNHVAQNYPHDCTLCHNTTNWRDASFDHNNTQFPLTGAHVSLSCASCHTSGYTGTPTDCYSCHTANYNNTTNPNHQTSGIPTTCAVCHSTTVWQPATFNHNNTIFPLTGAHVSVNCASCHVSGYTGTPTDCYSCHTTIYNNTTNPNHQASGIPTTCSVCHSTTAWQPATFNHNNTIFPLTGAHVSVNCASCHASGYTGTPTDCYSCHTTNYNNTTNPNHQASGIPTTCAVCHSTTAWQPATFNHNNTIFPLTGAHVSVNCVSCHASGYTGTPTDCYSCHTTDYNNTVNPNHQAVSFPTTCVDCHSTTAWQPATFDHDNAYFPIYSGTHKDKWSQCSECHTTPNNYSLFSCIDCHEHNRTDTDNQHGSVQGYNYNSADCFACHPDGRSIGAFNHATSGFPLTGVHLTASCADCHQNGYSGTSSVCSDCHISSYNNTTNPNHQSLSISNDCSTCHSTDANWQPALFPQHNQYFELLGRHLEIINNCNSCHNGNYSNTPNQCVNCHQQNYNSAINPNHSAAGLSTECASCHNSNAWSPSTFNHTTTGFTLLGAHQPLQCSSCHNGTVTGLTNDCVSCHQTNYNSAANHLAQSYPTNCELCHSSVNWNQTTFNHQNTSFPLTGAHTTTTCQSCHQSGYTNTPTDCFSCHTIDYNSTTNPNHQTSGILTTCIDCHSTTAWQPATFNHQSTNFPLTGAHQTVACSQCHQSGYTNTPTDCYACHTTDYNNTTNPNHTFVSFPTTCVDCHSTTAWQPATFDHDNLYFPIYSGRHLNQWTQCSECHTTPNNYSLFSCIDCHEHNRTSMDNDHQGVNNYVYNSINCYNCHPDGRSRSNFNHTETEFPLTGAHVQVECAQCHSTNQNRISTECVACHMQDYLKTVNPNHQSAGLSTDCISCHSTNNWSSGFKILEDNKVF